MDKSRTGGEWERMVSGRLYTPTDPEIAKRHRVGNCVETVIILKKEEFYAAVFILP